MVDTKSFVHKWGRGTSTVGFIGRVIYDAAHYMAVNAAVNGAYKGFGAVKDYKGRPMASGAPEFVYDDSGNAVPLSELRVFGRPGASLETAHNLDADARQAGIAGEQRVAAELELLAAFYPNMYIFHSVKLPGRTGDIDHVVIQGDRMMLIDSKNWRGDSAYHVYASTQDADYVSRDGENFPGGEHHLRRQTSEWQAEFSNTHLRVDAALVIANRTATVSEVVNAPYTIANIDGLALIFGNTFYQAGVPPMHPELLNRMLSMVQGIEVQLPAVAPASAPVARVTTTKTKLLVGWSIFNWTVMWLLFVIVGFSAIPLLITTHLHKVKVRRENLGGSGLLSTVLVFTYIQLAAWLAFVVYAIQNQGIPGVIEWGTK